MSTDFECFRHETKHHFFDEYLGSDDNPKKYCVSAGMKYDVNSTWNLPYPECANCLCASYGMECCGYGVGAGVEEPPKNCELAEDTCEIHFVRKDDPSQPCNGTTPAKPNRSRSHKKSHMKRKNLKIIARIKV
ncbi:unnamed protein product [Adineta ricciae]|uniref:Uncharacterized protein n=1 Tax=Adineta ricciae TaxID=249248 RepID=A0A814QBB5_ADIRI|nr:unnamed protein product [Adineta ricciae]CAF1117183.1 unnamed protein product [Adineta ricciae]